MSSYTESKGVSSIDGKGSARPDDGKGGGSAGGSKETKGAPTPNVAAPNTTKTGRRPHRFFTELGRPTVATAEGTGPDPREADPLVAQVQNMMYQGYTSCRLLLVSPNANGSSNASNVNIDATVDLTTVCTCPKPSPDVALSHPDPYGLEFVAHHSCLIAKQLFQEHESWCGVKLLHHGAVHAAWVGPFYSGDVPDVNEGDVRALLEERDLDAHARIFESSDFPEGKEDWDYVFQGERADNAE